MILADTLRDRIDDVIADMERQFSGFEPAFKEVVDDVLKSHDPTAYTELQRLGRQVIAPMIDHYGLASGTLTGEWYDLNRDLLKIGVWAGAKIQDPNTDTGPLIGGSVKDFGTTATILSGIQAGMELRVRQSANGTVMDSVLRDPHARGWERIASAGCCEYCGLLAARGAVYRSQFTATFCPHLNCHCMAAPAWGGSAESLRSRADTIATRRSLTDKQRASQNRQARTWIAQNRDTLGLLG